MHSIAMSVHEMTEKRKRMIKILLEYGIDRVRGKALTLIRRGASLPYVLVPGIACGCSVSFADSVWVHGEWSGYGAT